MGFFKRKNKYNLVNSDDPAVRQCLKRGFMPIADVAYIDEVLTEIRSFLLQDLLCLHG